MFEIPLVLGDICWINITTAAVQNLTVVQLPYTVKRSASCLIYDRAELSNSALIFAVNVLTQIWSEIFKNDFVGIAG